MNIKCCKCNLMATWWYMPGDAINCFYCDKCVPRGCSCNREYDENGNIIKEYFDDIGRSLPCCEYDYDENGYDKERFENLS